jgi:phosphonate transport system substrate-binding protein
MVEHSSCRWRRCLQALAVCMVGLLGLDGARAQALSVTLGLVAQNVPDEEARWRQVLSEVNAALSAIGMKLELRILSSHAGMLWQLADGEVDFFLSEPLMALKFAAETEARPVLALVGPERELQRAVIVGRRGSAQGGLSNLAGRTIAFDRPGSTIGHLLPRLALMEAGYQPFERTAGGASGSGTSEQVGFVFTMDPLSPIFWLFHGKVDAAAMPETAFARVDTHRPGMFRVLARSRPAPSGVLLARIGLDPSIGDAVTGALRGVRPACFSSPARFVRLTSDLQSTLDRLDAARVQIEADGTGERQP